MVKRLVCGSWDRTTQNMPESNFCITGQRSSTICIEFEICTKCYPLVGFEALAAVVKKISVFWDITPCMPLKVSRHFGGTCRFQLQGWRVSRTRNQYEEVSNHAGFFIYLLFNPEDRGDMFLRDVFWLSTDYMELYSRRRNSSKCCVGFEVFTCHLLARCLLNLFSDPEDGGDMFLRNVGCISTDYTASHPRRWYYS
jgi:hypothetical protein